ncbi:MAG TPA: dTDP-4-dehydrorhamnose 3,5-epimerase [Nitrososphaera sp.]|nr:dTDP-4-dehydrorhamnose 3,5-epimerase [Nitrososphaera sp.]
MFFTETELAGAYIIDLDRREDNRGFFARTWAQEEFEAHGLNTRVVQANMSYNHTRGTLRGMHYQRAPYAETKLVRCVQGAIYDVIIDLRPESATYKRWIGVELTAQNRRALYIPEGFAHGFQTLADNSDVTYQVSEFYTPGAEGGIRYNDPAFEIQWPLEVTVISEKDKQWPDFAG